MAEELGKIEKLDVEQFGLRNCTLYRCFSRVLMRLRIIRKSWKDTGVRSMNRFANQEVKVGKIQADLSRIDVVGGEEGLKIIEEINKLSYLIAKDKFDCGAVFEATELAELADECMDWERCLLMGLFSQKAMETAGRGI